MKGQWSEALGFQVYNFIKGRKFIKGIHLMVNKLIRLGPKALISITFNHIFRKTYLQTPNDCSFISVIALIKGRNKEISSFCCFKYRLVCLTLKITDEL